MIRWEYMDLNVRDTSDDIYYMNNLGSQGWELVDTGVDTGFGLRYLFKRPIRKKWWQR